MYYIESIENTEKYIEKKYMISVLRDNCFLKKIIHTFYYFNFFLASIRYD